MTVGWRVHEKRMALALIFSISKGSLLESSVGFPENLGSQKFEDVVFP